MEKAPLQLIADTGLAKWEFRRLCRSQTAYRTSRDTKLPSYSRLVLLLLVLLVVPGDDTFSRRGCSISCQVRSGGIQDIGPARS